MKRISFLFLALISIAFFSCQDNGDNLNVQITEEEKSVIIDEALQSAVLDDLLQDIDTYSLLGEGLKSAEMGDCPLISFDKPSEAPYWPRKTMLDFGDGCEKYGKVKSGKIIIEKSGPWYLSGSVREVTFENYVVDGMSISGEKKIENITVEGGNATFVIDAEIDLAWVKNDTLEITVHRDFNKTQEWILGFREKDKKGQIVLNGESEITRTVNGVTKKIEKKDIDVSIVFGCRFPQTGITEFEVLTYEGVELEFALDYSTEGAAGEKCRENCDCIATLIVEGDDSEDIDLSERWRKWAQEKKKDK